MEATPPIRLQGRFGCAGAALDGIFYLAGGSDGRWGDDRLQAFDPKTGVWTNKKPMSTPRAYFTLTALGGKLYAIGGQGFGAPSAMSLVEVYDPGRDVWSAAAPMPTARRSHGAAEFKGRIYVFGGFHPERASAASAVEVYNPITDSWKTLPPMPGPRYNLDVAAWGGKIFIAGGTPADRLPVPLDRVDIFDPTDGAWSAGPNLPAPRMGLTLRAVGNQLVAIGGFAQNRVHPNLWALFRGADHWVEGAPMPLPAYFFGSAVLKDEILVAGGSDGQIALAEFSRYDSAADRWISSAVLAEASPKRDTFRGSAGSEFPRAGPVSEVDSVKPAGRDQPDDLALVVGLEKYRSLPDADFAERDAEAVRVHLRDLLGLSESNILVLTGAHAARTDISKYLEEWIPRNATESSRLYVFFAGHGSPNAINKKAYLLPWDGDPAFLDTSGYPLEELYKRLAALPVREVIVILDSCFSGLGGRSILAKGLKPLVTVIQDPGRGGPRLSVMAAAAESETAGTIAKEGHGLFTYYFLRGLQGAADSDRDGHITLREVHEYLKETVPPATSPAGRRQNPQLYTDSPNLQLY